MEQATRLTDGNGAEVASNPRHIMAEVAPDGRTGTCVICGPVKVKYKRDRNYYQCETVVKRWKMPFVYDPETGRRDRLRKKYGLTVEQYEEMHAAVGGACEICGDLAQPLCVDHDHETGLVRGLLCTRCNQGLGNFRDDPSRMVKAIEYLARVSGSVGNHG